MKNLKNMVAALSLMAVLGFGAVSANAGLLISDRGGNGQQLCAPTTKDDILNALDGIIIIGAPVFDGIIIIGRDGLLISDKGTGCQNASKDGLLISD